MNQRDGELFRQLVEVRVALRKAYDAYTATEREINLLTAEREAILAQLRDGE